MHRSDDPNPSLTSLQILTRLQGGQFLHDLQGAFESVSAAVLRTGKAGKINVEISLDLVKGSTNAVFFRTEIKEKAPRPAAQSDVMYADKSGTLHLSDPNQYNLPLKPRPVEDARPKPDGSFDPETGEILSRAN